MSDEQSPWMCHVCDYCSTIGEGLVCSECYKLACRDHMTTATVLNQQTGLYEIRQICVECQFKKKL
jgi:hypothetical protein